MNILIRSAKIIDKNSLFNGKVVDVLIEDGIIVKIEQNIVNKEKYKEIQKEDLHLSIGWIDFRTNICDPGFEEKEDLESALNAAAKGGFTNVVSMPTTNPVIGTKSNIAYLLQKSENNIVTILPTGSLTANCEGKEIAEMYDMHSAGAVAFTDNKNSITNPNLLKRALLYAKSIGTLLMIYPNDTTVFNNGQINEGEISTRMGIKGAPSLAEELAVSQAIFLAEYCDAAIHLTNISSKKSVELIREAKTKNIKVTADVASYHLLLDENKLTTFNSNYKVLPPLRTSQDILELKKGIKDGTIDIICSDHTPENIENKLCEFDNASFGIINAQTSFSVGYTALKGTINLDDYIEKITSSPCNVLNVVSPSITIGNKANLTLFSPNKLTEFTEETIVSKSLNSPFIAEKLLGKVYGIINNNKINIE